MPVTPYRPGPRAGAVVAALLLQFAGLAASAQPNCQIHEENQVATPQANCELSHDTLAQFIAWLFG